MISLNVQDYKIKTTVAIGIGGIGLACLTYNNWKHCQARWKFTELRKKKQLERKDVFEKLKTSYKLIPDFQIIINYPLDVLISKLQNRELTSAIVLAAYLAKSLEVTEEFNCITEYVPYAMKIAEELDKLPSPKGPLHGIPFCVKDDTDLEGMDTTIGYSKNLYKPVKSSATLVQCLINLGAVPFCKTNLPQTCIAFSSHNPIFGETLNANNKLMSPGGSSSGTGCLVKANGAPFGTGTDTGGSLRIPAHFNGISTIKPTKNRLSRKGLHFCVENCVGFPSTGCVLAKHPSEVTLILKLLTANSLQNKLDPKAVPVPWNETLFKSERPLRIGYYTNLEIFPPIGDMESTILRAKETLESLGHTLVPFNGIDSVKAFKLCNEIINADLGKHVVKALEHDEISYGIADGLIKIAKTAIWWRKLLTAIPILQTHHGWSISGLSTMYSSDLWDKMAERKKITDGFLGKMEELNLDLLICPPCGIPAVRADEICKLIPDAFSYTFIYNLLDLPAGIIRFGVETGKNIESSDAANASRRFAIQCVKKSVGMPIGVQFVAKPYMEEVVLRGMVELEKSMGYIQLSSTANTVL